MTNTENTRTLSELAEAQYELTRETEKAVIQARDEGSSWAAIAAALGMSSKQAAQQKYGQAVRVEESSRRWQQENPEKHAAAVARGEAEAAQILEKILEKIRQRAWTAPSKILDESVAGDSVTPSIFLEPAAPAKAWTPQDEK